VEKKKVRVLAPFQLFHHGSIRAIDDFGAKYLCLTLQFKILPAVWAKEVRDRAVVSISVNVSFSTAWAINLMMNPIFTQDSDFLECAFIRCSQRALKR